MNKRGEELEISCEEQSVQQLKAKHEEAQEEWRAIVEKGIELRNEELLNLCDQSLDRDEPKIVNK